MKKIFLFLGFVGLLSTNVLGMEIDQVSPNNTKEMNLVEIAKEERKPNDQNKRWDKFIQGLNYLETLTVSNKIKNFINFPLDKHEKNLFHMAIIFQLPTIVEKLIKRGADVNQRCYPTEGNLTPLHLAAAKFSGNGEIIELLLQNGANSNALTEGYGMAVQKINFLEILCSITILFGGSVAKENINSFLEKLLQTQPDFLLLKDGAEKTLTDFITSEFDYWFKKNSEEENDYLKKNKLNVNVYCKNLLDLATLTLNAKQKKLQNLQNLRNSR